VFLRAWTAEAGGFVFVNHCVGTIGQPVEAQVEGAFDHLARRFELVGLTLASVACFNLMLSPTGARHTVKVRSC